MRSEREIRQRDERERRERGEIQLEERKEIELEKKEERERETKRERERERIDDKNDCCWVHGCDKQVDVLQLLEGGLPPCTAQVQPNKDSGRECSVSTPGTLF